MSGNIRIMKVSIITTCKNSENTISNTLKSVSSQKYKNIEYIIIDGSSTDNTLKILNEYQSCIDLIVSEEDGGIYNAMNKGINLATGEIIGFLNSDDYFIAPSVIENIVKKFYDTDADFVYSNILLNNNDQIHEWVCNEYIPSSFSQGWHPPHPGLYVKKNVYNKIGLFDETLRISADYDFMLRLFEIGNFKGAYLPEFIVNYRLGGTSSKNIKNILIGNYNIYRSLKKNSYKVNILKFFYKRLFPKLKRIF